MQFSLKCKLWFLDGKVDNGKTVSNPNIGQGELTIKYSNSKDREFYQIGLSAIINGISIYIMGIDDKKYLSETYGYKLGKACVTGYCIKFKTLKVENIILLEEAIRFGIEKGKNMNYKLPEIKDRNLMI